jgi:S-adenosylmethionine hydrolase
LNLIHKSFEINENTPVLVTLLTDFGLRDTYVAEVKAVLLQAPSVSVVDLTHHISPFDIEAGAFQLWRSYRFFAPGTWHLAVVDPGVGTERRAIYVRTKQYHFVGPDNGLLSWAVRDAETRDKHAGKFFQINPKGELHPTFHARDLFAVFIRDHILRKHTNIAPVLSILGSSFPVEKRTAGLRRGEILIHDHYGNGITTLAVNNSEQISHAEIAGRSIHVAPNYASIAHGKVALVPGSHGLWELATREGSAKEMHGLKRGTPIKVFVIK